MDSRQIAKRALEIEAIKLDPVNFFQDKNIFKSIYLNLENFLVDYKDRSMIINSFIENLGSYCEGFAAISNSGTIIASSLLENYKGDYIFLKDRRIENRNFESEIKSSIDDNGPRKRYYLDYINNLNGKEFVLVDHVLKTGCAIVRAVFALRREKINCNKFLCIFDFGYNEIKKILNGEIGFNKYNHKLNPPVKNISLFDLETLLDVAVDNHYLNEEYKKDILLWRDNYAKWKSMHFYISPFPY